MTTRNDDYDAVPPRPVTDDEIEELLATDFADEPNPPYDLPAGVSSWAEWSGA